MRLLVRVSVLLASLFAFGCRDCGSNCDRAFRECLDDPRSETIECDLGYDQCLMSCNPSGAATSSGAGSASHDGG